MKKSITVPMFAVAAILLAACNTVEGVGRDVQAGGEAIETTADEVQNDLSE